MPARSTGCFTCRRRKIRCDEQRPGCKRCLIHGVSCSGYATAAAGEFQFTDQTPLIVQRAQKQSNGKGSSTIVRAKESSSLVRSSPSGRLSTGMVLIGNDHHWSTPWMEWHDERMTFITLPPRSLHSPAATRHQIHAKLLELHSPKDVGQHRRFFFESLLTRPVTAQPLLSGLDALALVTVGLVAKDDRITQQAVSSYGMALNGLLRTLSRPAAAVEDETLAAVAVLAQCELFDVLRGSSMRGWASHINGAQLLLSAQRPEALMSDLSLSTFSSIRHDVVCYALIERKAPPFAKQSWRKILRENLPQDSFTEFYDAALQLPGLLEMYDRLDVHSPTALMEVDKLLGKYESVERKLRNWLLGCETCALLQLVLPYELVPIESLTTFARLCRDRTFTEAFMFSDFTTAYLSTMYWQCMYAMRTALRSLHKIRTTMEIGWYPATEQTVLEEELLGYVLNLCQSIPFFCESTSAFSGDVAIFLPMRTAALYFRQHGRWHQLRWIGAMRTSILINGLSPPVVGPNTEVHALATFSVSFRS